MQFYWKKIEGLTASKELVSWDEAVRRCKTSSDEPLYLPGFSDEQFKEAGEYMNKHEIKYLWINLKYSKVFVWNNGTVYGWYFSIFSNFCLLYIYVSMSGIFVAEAMRWWYGECGILNSDIIYAGSCDILRYVTCQENGK